MKRYWEQLTSQERRVLAVVGVVVFIVLQIWFVRPHFHDFHKATVRIDKARGTLAMFRAEIAKRAQYDSAIRSATADAADVPLEEGDLNFARAYQDRANEAGVVIQLNGRIMTRTNDPFFVEKEVGLNVIAKENELVDYLYSLSAGNSLTRVKAMGLRPDQSHQKLQASMTIVASYQRKAAARTEAAPRGSGAKPAAAPEKATAKAAAPPPGQSKAAAPPTARDVSAAAAKTALASNRTAAAIAARAAARAGAGQTNKPAATLGARPAATNKNASLPTAIKP